MPRTTPVKSEIVKLRIAAGDLKRWSDAARADQASLADWVRRRCDGDHSSNYRNDCDRWARCDAQVMTHAPRAEASTKALGGVIGYPCGFRKRPTSDVAALPARCDLLPISDHATRA